MQMSRFSNVRQLVPALVSLSWSQFVLDMRPQMVAHLEKKDLPAFSPAIYAPGQSRMPEHLIGIHFGVLDFDGVSDQTLEFVRERARKYDAVLLSTWSHGKTKETSGNNNVRLCVRFREPVKLENWRDCFAALRSEFGDFAEDLSDAGRMYFDPLYPRGTSEASIVYEVFSGEAFDWRQVFAPSERYNSTLAQFGYDAYGRCPNSHGPWKTFDGREMPSWDELSKTERGQETQRRWEVAAGQIILRFMTQEMQPSAFVGITPQLFAEKCLIWAEAIRYKVDTEKLFAAFSVELSDETSETPASGVQSLESNSYKPALDDEQAAEPEPLVMSIEDTLWTDLVRARTRAFDEGRFIVSEQLGSILRELDPRKRLPSLGNHHG